VKVEREIGTVLINLTVYNRVALTLGGGFLHREFTPYYQINPTKINFLTP
jgi:hypothetical protein